MNVTDVTMLGFVKAAEAFAAKHHNDGTDLGDLKNMNIDKMKNELSEKLNLLSMSDEYKNALLSVGEKAFDEYAKEHFSNKKNVLDELGEIFNVDLGEDEKEEEILEESEREILEELKPEEVEVVQNDFGIKDDDDVLLTIKSAAAKTDDELSKAFNDVVEHETNEVEEDIVDEPTIEEDVVEEDASQEIYNPDKEETTLDLDSINNTQRDDYVPLSMELRKIKTDSEMSIPIEELRAELDDEIHKDEIEEVVEEEKEETEQLEVPNEFMSTRVLVNPALDVVLELEKQEDGSFYEIDAPSEANNNDNQINGILVNPGIEAKQENNRTLSSILSSLEDLKDRQQNKALIEEEYRENAEVYAQIKEAYPYLSDDFIKNVYSQKGEIEKEYTDKGEYILLHRLIFSDIDELHEFVEVMMSHGYETNVDEKQMIVDTFCSIVNEEGIILASIFGVANQAKVLNGVYDGYCVINKETI